MWKVMCVMGGLVGNEYKEGNSLFNNQNTTKYGCGDSWKNVYSLEVFCS